MSNVSLITMMSVIMITVLVIWSVNHSRDQNSDLIPPVMMIGSLE